MYRSMMILSLISCGLVLSGCPDDFSFYPPYDCSGSYSGAWTSNEVEGYKVDCPIYLDLTQSVDALWPANHSITGTATLDLTCFPIADALIGAFVSLDPVPVSGYLTDDGFLFLATPSLLETCQEGVCIKLVFEGDSDDSDGDGLMDSYEGGWIGTVSINSIPVPLAGEFSVSSDGGSEE